MDWFKICFVVMIICGVVGCAGSKTVTQTTINYSVISDDFSVSTVILSSN